MRFIFEQIRTGGDRNFAYLIGDRDESIGILVDPSFDPEACVERAREQGLRIALIVNTHGHSDHTNGNDKAKKLTQAKLAAYRNSLVNPDMPLSDNEKLAVGFVSIRILHTPGHSEDHIVLYLAEQKVAITGDLLFVGKIGGTGNESAAKAEYESLQRVLLELPDETTVWPGHDYGCRPSSTIALERKTNPFLLVPDYDEFLVLKSGWASYKKKLGLK